MLFFKNLVRRFIILIRRWPGVVAVFGFISGTASYLLVEGRESLAQIFAVLMLVSWGWLVMGNWLRAGLLKRFGLDIPPGMMHFVTQMVHQESLFFALPFFIAVTSWYHGQAIFTAVLILCALVSVIDPLYYKQLAARRSLYIAFHALALFAVLLVVLPLILLLTTTQSLGLALVIALIFSLPSLSQLLVNGQWRRLPLLLLVLMVLAGGIWLGRSWVPPAALRLAAVTISQHLDVESKEPGEEVERISQSALMQQGLYVWTAVQAPRGLREQIFHEWMHEGKALDRIALDIQGGREEGYRAWTHKLNFPDNSAGRWQVRVLTESGQLIGLGRFTVIADN